MCATYIRCGAERHLGRESMGVLMQATLPACREELLARYAGSVQTVYLDPPFNTGKRFDMKVRVGENGKMFGSVTSKDVAEALIKQTGLNIDRRKIELKSAVKGLGEYTAVAKLHTDVTATFKVMVEAE